MLYIIDRHICLHIFDEANSAKNYTSCSWKNVFLFYSNIGSLNLFFLSLKLTGQGNCLSLPGLSAASRGRIFLNKSVE